MLRRNSITSGFVNFLSTMHTRFLCCCRVRHFSATLVTPEIRTNSRMRLCPTGRSRQAAGEDGAARQQPDRVHRFLATPYSLSGMSSPSVTAYRLERRPCEPLGAPHGGIPARAWHGPRRPLRVFTCGAPSSSSYLWRPRRCMDIQLWTWATCGVFEKWCPGEDSNLHELLHWYLKPARLPVPPPGQGSLGARRRNLRTHGGLVNRRRRPAG
jgi:hypothetical protein